MAGTVMATPICTTVFSIQYSVIWYSYDYPNLYEIKKMEKGAGSPRTFKVQGVPPLPSGLRDLGLVASHAAGQRRRKGE